MAVGSDGNTAPPPPPKKSKDIPNVQGGKYMHLACYAQDIKEPDLIGETRVDLTEVLTKGETDGMSIPDSTISLCLKRIIP